MSKISESKRVSRFSRTSAQGAVAKRSSLAGAAFLALAASSAFANAASAGETAQAARIYKPSELLVTFKSGASSQGAHASNARIGTQGVEAYARFGTQKVKLPAGMTVAQAISLYSQDPNVLLAQPNYRYRLKEATLSQAGRPFPLPVSGGGSGGTSSSDYLLPNDPLKGYQWGLKKIKAPQAWKISQGSSNVVVAVLDSGIRSTHVDLTANMWRNGLRTVDGVQQGEIPGNGIDDDGNGYIDDYNGINAVGNNSNVSDDNGHGTHVAGIIGATGNNGKGGVGVNWRVQLMALKCFDADGSGTTADILQCFQYMIDMKVNRGVNVRVANLSFGSAEIVGQAADPLEMQAFNDAGDAGILCTVAAGNDGEDNANVAEFPANFALPNMISVAASGFNDNLASFSNYGGTTVNLAAPGVKIGSTYSYYEYRVTPVPTATATPNATATARTNATPTATPTATATGTPSGTPQIIRVPSDRAYKFLSGTSMATPFVSGSAALIWARFPNLTLAQVKNDILASVDYVAALDGKVISNGRLNLQKAMAFASNDSNGIPNQTPTGTPSGSGTPIQTPTAPPTSTGTGTATPTATATPLNPSLQPPVSPTPLASGPIVFDALGDSSGQRDIYSVSPNGGARVDLTNNSADDFQPNVNVRAKKIVFTSNLADIPTTRTQDNNEIYIMNLDGTGSKRLTKNNVDDSEPAISPDGNKVLFVSSRDTDPDSTTVTYDIYVMDLTKNDLAGFPVVTRLTTGGNFTRDNEIGPISSDGTLVQGGSGLGIGIGSGSNRNLGQPVWRPDGKVIVFTSNRPIAGVPQNSDIYVMTPDGLNQTNLTRDLKAPVYIPNDATQQFDVTYVYSDDRNPAISIYGQIAFTSNLDDGDSNPNTGSPLGSGLGFYTYYSGSEGFGPGFYDPLDPPRRKVTPAPTATATATPTATGTPVPSPAPGANGIFNGGFETPGVATFQFQPNAANQYWIFGTSSGIAKNGSPLNNPTAPEGTQVGFLQGNGAASDILQKFYGQGTITVSFQAAQRPGNVPLQGIQADIVDENGNVVRTLGTAIPVIPPTPPAATPTATPPTPTPTATPVPTPAFQSFSFTAVNIPTGGYYFLRFRGTTASLTAFIDNVSLSSDLGPVPTPPATATPTPTPATPTPVPGPTPEEGSPGTTVDTGLLGLNNYDLYVFNSDGNGPNLPPGTVNPPVQTVAPTRLTRDFRQTDRSIRGVTNDTYPNHLDINKNQAYSSLDGTGSFLVENIQPTFSPDGTQIAFASNRRPIGDIFPSDNRRDPKNTFNLWRLTSDSRGLFQITTDVPQRVNERQRLFFYNLEPTWSSAIATPTATATPGGTTANSTTTERKYTLSSPPRWQR